MGTLAHIESKRIYPLNFIHKNNIPHGEKEDIHMLKKIWEATDTDRTWLDLYIIGYKLIQIKKKGIYAFFFIL